MPLGHAGSPLPLLAKWKNSDRLSPKKFAPQIVMTSSMDGWTKYSNITGRSHTCMFSKFAHRLVTLHPSSLKSFLHSA
ncbi:hypothetical protein BS17DRAFT_566697 [Gyrodon lividus]|nr:hypothetical protein BS17DRAFT_566697 [Gyrodon lividus]